MILLCKFQTKIQTMDPSELSTTVHNLKNINRHFPALHMAHHQKCCNFLKIKKSWKRKVQREWEMWASSGRQDILHARKEFCRKKRGSSEEERNSHLIPEHDGAHARRRRGTDQIPRQRGTTKLTIAIKATPFEFHGSWTPGPPGWAPRFFALKAPPFLFPPQRSHLSVRHAMSQVTSFHALRSSFSFSPRGHLHSKHSGFTGSIQLPFRWVFIISYITCQGWKPQFPCFHPYTEHKLSTLILALSQNFNLC